MLSVTFKNWRAQSKHKINENQQKKKSKKGSAKRSRDTHDESDFCFKVEESLFLNVSQIVCALDPEDPDINHSI
jgi:hypothetical protein